MTTATDGKSRGCWHHMSQTKRCLVYAIVLLSVVIIMLAIYIGITATKRKPAEIKNMCVTRDCIESADLIRTSINPSVDPCKDFYEYSCGSFTKNNQHNPLAQIYGSYHAIISLIEAATLTVKNIMEKPATEEDKLPTRELKIAFQSCMEELMSKDPPWSKIKDLLNENGIRNWPRVLNNWREDKFNAEEVLINFITRRIPLFFELERFPYVPLGIYIYKVKTMTSRFALNENYVGDYRMFMVDVFEAMDVPDAQTVADNVIQFQAKVETTFTEEKPSEVRSLAQMDQAFPGWNFNETYAKICEILDFKDKDINTMRFWVFNENTLEYIPSLIRETDKRTVMSYMAWQFIFHVSQYASADLRWKYRVMRMKTVEDTYVYEPWKQCVDHIRPHFPEALTLAYATEMFSQDMLNEVRRYFDGIKRSFRKVVPKQPWINEELIKSVYKKLDNMTTVLSYPPELMKSKDIEKKYAAYGMVPGDFMSNMLKLDALKTLAEISAVGSAEYLPDWPYDPMSINAANLLYENKIVIAIGILFPPFFQINRPRYLNYGTCGFLMAHELGHTFDTGGIVTHSTTKWSEENVKIHSKLAQCFVDQYNNYLFDGSGALPQPVKVDGRKTVDDNIADHVGLTHAYRAYREFRNSNGPEPLLPGLNYTESQLFFIQFAQTWCAAYSTGGAQRSLADTHAPNKWRINGPLSNHPEFSEVFNCPKGSPMNPVKKCTLWN